MTNRAGKSKAHSGKAGLTPAAAAAPGLPERPEWAELGELVFQKHPQVMWVFDTKTLRFLDANEAATQRYGYSRDEFLAMTLKDIRPAEDIPHLLGLVARDFPHFQSAGLARHIYKSGEMVEVEIVGCDLDWGGQRARLVLVTPVSGHRHLDRQIEQAARLEALGEVAGGIAHDLNNLLTAVNGYADLLTAGLQEGEHREYAREIRRAGARAAALTSQVLTFAGRQVLEPRAVDVKAIVASLAPMLGRLLGEHVRVVTDVDQSETVVLADPSQLEQVLVNLTVNAGQAMPDGGVLTIGVRRVEDAAPLGRDVAGPAVLLTVTDTGAGMDEATLGRVFEPFFTTKGPGRGTGLGLATAYGVVRQSGGDIWAVSAPGHGTTFSVVLPSVNAAPEPPPAPPPVEPPTGRGRTILVVEDERAVRAFAVSTLEREGFSVLVAASPAQAVALAEGLGGPIHLLLTDVVMPDSDGRALAERLTGDRPDLKVLFMSGYAPRLDAPQPDYRSSFLAKPFGRDELLRAVHAVLRGRDSLPPVIGPRDVE